MTSAAKFNGHDKTSKYNYSRFRVGDLRIAAFDALNCGEVFPNLELTSLTGEREHIYALMSDQTVIVTGSLSCPTFIDGIPRLISLIKEYPAVTFVVLYVRETHPGVTLRPHTSMNQKVEYANLLKTKYPALPDICVDSLDGSAHRYLGGMPNACLILDSAKRVTYRSSWLKLKDVQIVLSGLLLDNKDSSSDGLALPDIPRIRTTIDTLSYAGRGAVVDFIVTLPKLIRNRSQLKRHLARKMSKQTCRHLYE